MADPKFGWNSVWIAPIAAAAVSYYVVADIWSNYKQRKKIQEIRKRHPDIDQLAKLSGIDEYDS